MRTIVSSHTSMAEMPTSLMLFRGPVSPPQKKKRIFDTVSSVVVSDLTESELVELQESTQRDEQMNQMKVMISTGWSQRKQDCPTALTPFWDFQDELSVSQYVTVKGQAFLIPVSLRDQYVHLAHSTHQGPDAYIRRARDIISWPGINADV